MVELARAARPSTAPCRPIRPCSRPFFDSHQQALPGHQARLGRRRRRCCLPGHPQPPGLGARLRQVQDGLPGLPEQVPHDSRGRHRRRAGDVEDHPPGIFDAATTSASSSSPSRAGVPPPGRRYLPVPSPTTRSEPGPAMTESTRGAAARDAAPTRFGRLVPPAAGPRGHAGASSSSARGSSACCCSRPGPMIASLVMSLTNFDLRPPRGGQVHRHRQLRRGWRSDPMVAKSLIATFKFALIAIPVTMVASLGVRRPAEQPEARSARAACGRSSTCRS